VRCFEKEKSYANQKTVASLNTIKVIDSKNIVTEGVSFYPTLRKMWMGILLRKEKLCKPDYNLPAFEYNNLY